MWRGRSRRGGIRAKPPAQPCTTVRVSINPMRSRMTSSPIMTPSPQRQRRTCTLPTADQNFTCRHAWCVAIPDTMSHTEFSVGAPIAQLILNRLIVQRPFPMAPELHVHKTRRSICSENAGKQCSRMAGVVVTLYIHYLHLGRPDIQKFEHSAVYIYEHQ